MIKSLVIANRSEREKFKIPRSVQETIPIRCVYPDGIFLVGNKHSKSWRLSDVNYAATSDEERRNIFLSYGGVLNSLPTDAATKITIINRRLNPADFERSILMEERWDGLDKYREEANAIIKRRDADCRHDRLVIALLHAVNPKLCPPDSSGTIECRKVLPVAGGQIERIAVGGLSAFRNRDRMVSRIDREGE